MGLNLRPLYPQWDAKGQEIEGDGSGDLDLGLNTEREKEEGTGGRREVTESEVKDEGRECL